MFKTLYNGPIESSILSGKNIYKNINIYYLGITQKNTFL